MASPWQVWHMLPSASFFAPCAERSIAFHWASWQFAHTGLIGGAWRGGCASAGSARNAETASGIRVPATMDLSLMGVALLPVTRKLRAHEDSVPCVIQPWAMPGTLM